MIYHLFQYLESVGVDFPGIGLMNFLSFRAMLAAVTAVLVSMLAGKRIIRRLQLLQIGETVRDLGLEGQIQKKGTPTMGGIIIIVAILSGVLLFCDLTNIYVQLLVVSTLWCGGLGFADDYIKVFKHNKEGMSERGKLIGQVLLGLLVGLTVWMSPDIVVREKVAVQTSVEHTLETETTVTSGRYVEEDVVKSTKTTIPFVKNHEFDYRWCQVGTVRDYDCPGHHRLLQRHQPHRRPGRPGGRDIGHRGRGTGRNGLAGRQPD